MSITEQIDCELCMKRHTKRYACDPILAMLTEMRRRGAGLNLPSTEFDQPMFPGMQPGDVLLAGVTVAAGLIPVPAFGATYPAIVISGNRAGSHNPMPRWIYAAPPDGLRKVKDLVASMVDLAIGKATT